jgi:hypothetical protein
VTRQRFKVCFEIFRWAAASSTVRSVVVVMMSSFQALARGASERPCKTNQNKDRHTNPACSPNSGKAKIIGYPHDIHRCFVGFREFPTRLSMSRNTSLYPAATLRQKSERARRKATTLGVTAKVHCIMFRLFFAKLALTSIHPDEFQPI